MSAHCSLRANANKHRRPLLREDAIPDMTCRVHQQRELSSRIEYYENTPDSAFCLPSSTHHWLLCQNVSAPDKILVQADETEADLSGLNRQHVIYLPPSTRTQWEFTAVEGSTHILIPDKLFLHALSNERVFATIQERGALLGTVMPRLAKFVQARSKHLSSESTLSELALSAFVLDAAEVLASEFLAQFDEQKLPVFSPGVLGISALRLVEDFMWDNIERNITLAELSNLVQLSPFYFSRNFKQETGTSPHQALLRIRVRKARILLPQAMTLTEIGYRCGFSDQAHFTRVFKAQTGFTPKQFRKATA